MNNYVEIPLGRIWRLVVMKRSVEQEYIIPEFRLAGLIENLTSEPDILSVSCTPYRGTSIPDIWMVSRAPSRTAA